MQGNTISTATKTDQTQGITFPQVEWKFVSPVQTGVKFCAIKKPSCVMDSHFITYHRRLCPTAFSLDNLRKTVSNVRMTKTMCLLDINSTYLDVLPPSVAMGLWFTSVIWTWTDDSVCRLAVLQMREPLDGSAAIRALNWQQLAPAYRSLYL